MDQATEKFIRDRIFPDFERGRPGWDKPHMIAVVVKIREILEHTPNLNVDGDVLVVAGYAHDWGYSGLYAAGKPLTDLSEINVAKARHQESGAEKISGFLHEREFSFLSDTKKNRIVHLVRVHDTLSELRDPDELVLMEADTLGSLDTSFVRPTLSPESNEKLLVAFTEKRLPKFLTGYGKREFRRLFELRKAYYADAGKEA